MPYTKADRIVRKRRNQEEAEQRRREVEAELQARNRFLSTRYEISAEIPVVLRLLAELNYPGMTKILVPDKWLGLIERSVLKAAWQVGWCQLPDGGWESTMCTYPIYLLSDGRLSIPRGQYNEPFWPRSMIRNRYYNIEESCLNGLRELRHRLEEMEK